MIYILEIVVQRYRWILRKVRRKKNMLMNVYVSDEINFPLFVEEASDFCIGIYVLIDSY